MCMKRMLCIWGIIFSHSRFFSYNLSQFLPFFFQVPASKVAACSQKFLGW